MLLWICVALPGGCYPYWFLSPHTIEADNDVDLDELFDNYEPQVFYVYSTRGGFAHLFVHTPQIDPPGYYALFRSNRYDRDHVLTGDGQDLVYAYHRELA